MRKDESQGRTEEASAVPTQSVLAVVKRSRVRQLKQCMQLWHQRTGRMSQQERFANRVMLRQKTQYWNEFRRKATELQAAKVITRQRNQLLEVSSMSKKYIAMNTLLSSINVNHKVCKQKVFNQMKGEETSVLPQVHRDASACQYRLGRMVSLFESIRMKHCQKKMAFLTVQQQLKVNEYNKEVKVSPYTEANMDCLFRSIQNVTITKQFRTLFAKLKEVALDRKY